MIAVAFFAFSLSAFVFSGIHAAFFAALKVHSSATLGELAEQFRFAKFVRFVAQNLSKTAQAVKFLSIFWQSVALVFLTLVFEEITETLVWASLIALLTGSALFFIFIESYANDLGRRHAAKVITMCAFFVRLNMIVLKPLRVVVGGLERVFTPEKNSSTLFSSEDQLLNIVDEATASEVLEEDDRELIHSIFDFNETVVREIMVPRTDMVTLEVDTSLDQALEVFFASGTSRIPLVGNTLDDIVGLLYLRDVAQHVFSQFASDANSAKSLMKEAFFVPESQKIDSLLHDMQKNAVHIAIVIDEYGGVSGLVTLEDLIEELVGEIFDEYDQDPMQIRVVGPNRYHVSSRLPITTLGELFGKNIEDEDVDSVGGLISKTLGKMLEVGSKVSVEGLTLEVLSKDHKQNGAATVSATPEEAPHTKGILS